MNSRDKETDEPFTNVESVSKKSLSEGVAEQIRDLIKTGKLRPADRIPSERELSKAFNVSRVTFREAIKLLEKEGLLRTFPGNGTFVTTQSVGSNSAFLFQEISRNNFRPPEILRLRQMIEPQIANMAAMRATAKDLSELSAIFENQEQGSETEKQDSLFVNFDHDFHKKIGKIAGNSLLLQILDWAIGALQESRLLAVSNAENDDRLCEGHKEILNAIRSGDGPLAEKVMRKHLEDVENLISIEGKSSRLEAFESEPPNGKD